MRLISDPNSKQPTYLQYRERFLDLSYRLGLSHIEQNIPGLGMQGEALNQDFAYLNQDHPVTLLHVSGVHGIEGFLGSSIQAKILSTMAGGLKESKVNLIFLHALNPFGMSWYRRANEQNVDLNRNGLEATNIPENENVRSFARFLQSSSEANLILNIPQALWHFKRLGLKNSTQAIAGGQWEFPQSLFYGGREIQAEYKNLPGMLLKCAPNTKKFYVIDVHSGLGKWAYDSLFVSRNQYQQLSFFKACLDESANFSHISFNPSLENSEFYRSQGGLEDFLARTMSQNEIHYLTQEFGTNSSFRVLFALILENARYKAKPRDPRRPGILLNEFYPNSEKWRRTCELAGLKRYVQVFEALQSL